MRAHEFSTMCPITDWHLVIRRFRSIQVFDNCSCRWIINRRAVGVDRPDLSPGLPARSWIGYSNILALNQHIRYCMARADAGL